MSLYEDIVTVMESKDDVESELPSVLVDQFLDLRVGSIVSLRKYVNEQRVIDVLLEEVRTLRERPEFRRRLKQHLRDVLKSENLVRTELHSLFPDELLKALNDIVTRNYRADPALVRSLVDHPAMKTVMRNVLEETLREFVRRVTNWIRESETVPGMSGAWSLFTGFFGMAHRYTKRFASRLEERVQQQVDRFVEEMIDEVLNKLVQELCSEEVREDLSAWRGRVLNELLDRSLEDYLEGLEGEENPLDRLVDALLDELAEGERSAEFLGTVSSLVVRFLEEQRLRDVLRLLRREDWVRRETEQLLRDVLFGERNPAPTKA